MFVFFVFVFLGFDVFVFVFCALFENCVCVLCVDVFSCFFFGG